MNTKLICLLTGVLALNLTPFLHAEDNDAGKPVPRASRPGGPDPAKIKMATDLGLNPEELKNLSQEERRAKFVEAAKNKKAELEKKKADGTLTAGEKDMLQRMSNFRGGPGPGQGPGQRPGQGERGNRPAMEQSLKDLGLTVEDLKNLPPEERRAKLMEASKAKKAELEKKKTDGTLTDADKEVWKRMEERRKTMQERGSRPDGQK